MKCFLNLRTPHLYIWKLYFREYTNNLLLKQQKTHQDLNYLNPCLGYFSPHFLETGFLCIQTHEPSVLILFFSPSPTLKT